MTAPDVFRRILSRLDLAGIPHMLTGSFASSHYGDPRGTQDIDLVISPTSEQLRAFVGSLSSTEYYVHLGAALDALRLESQFNVVDLETGWKVDLIIRKSRPFSRGEFDRRVQLEMQGVRVFIATAEDVILAKLEWAKLGESDRQVADAAGILRVRRGDIDLAYVAKWVEVLDIARQWEAAYSLSR